MHFVSRWSVAAALTAVTTVCQAQKPVELLNVSYRPLSIASGAL